MYRAFYNLGARPFQLIPNPKFFFGSNSHRRALAYLRYGLGHGEGFVVVTGDVGTGKTTIARMLMKGLNPERVVASQVVMTQVGPDDLLRLVAAGFGLPYQRVGKASLIAELEGFFRACDEEGKSALVVVDEAQSLPARALEELRMLINLQSDDRSLVQCFLLGQKEFRQTRRSKGFEQLRQRVVAAYHLSPLRSKEIRGYIEHRLQVVGWREDPQFEPDAYTAIYEQTSGVPRRINTLCERLLLYGYLQRLHVLGREAVLEVSGDIKNEQGGETSVADQTRATGEGLRVAQPIPSADRPSDPPPPKPASVDAEHARLAQLESSMQTLAQTLRTELSLLREQVSKESPPEPAARSSAKFPFRRRP